MASACLSDVHNYTTSVCSFPQWQAAQGFLGYAVRKRCRGGSSFNIHYNTLFIKQADHSYPFTTYTSCNALPLQWFLLGLWDAHVVLYQECLAIISLSPTGQFSDLHTACSLHLYPVYVDFMYTLWSDCWCESYSNFARGITVLVHVNQVNRNCFFILLFFPRDLCSYQGNFSLISCNQTAAHPGTYEFSIYRLVVYLVFCCCWALLCERKLSKEWMEEWMDILAVLSLFASAGGYLFWLRNLISRVHAVWSCVRFSTNG